MTFTEIVTEVAARLNLTSSEATTRIGRNVNIRYKRLTTALGLQTSRRTTVQATATLGVSTLAFTSIEKIINVQDRSDSATAPRILDEVTVEEIREASSDRDEPTKYAILTTSSTGVTILMDCVPQTAFTLYADAHAVVSTLSGSNEPAFSESFHDILIEGAIADELRKQEKLQLARDQELVYEARLGDLQMWIAKSAYQDIYQGKRSQASAGGSGGGSSSTPNGAASYTQTGLITFDRDPSAPFAVTASSAVVPNLDADKLDGEEGSAYHNATNLNAGTVPDARFPATLPAASGVNLTALNATNLASGTVPDARFPATLPAASGVNLTALNGTNIASGTVADARLSSNIPKKDAANTFTAAGNNFDEILAVDKGLQFPSTQVASGDANVLDDYEEGTFTPTFLGAGGQSGQVYSRQVGRYQKVGKWVHVSGRITLSTLGTLTGAVLIGGLPFTSLNLTGGQTAITVGFWSAMTATFVFISGYVDVNTTTAVMQGLKVAATATANLAQADLSATTDVMFSATYETAG